MKIAFKSGHIKHNTGKRKSNTCIFKRSSRKNYFFNRIINNCLLLEIQLSIRPICGAIKPACCQIIWKRIRALPCHVFLKEILFRYRV